MSTRTVQYEKYFFMSGCTIQWKDLALVLITQIIIAMRFYTFVSGGNM